MSRGLVKNQYALLPVVVVVLVLVLVLLLLTLLLHLLLIYFVACCIVGVDVGFDACDVCLCYLLVSLMSFLLQLSCCLNFIII